jgi:hypothetical protein
MRADDLPLARRVVEPGIGDPGQGLGLPARGGDGKRHGRARPPHHLAHEPHDEENDRQIGDDHAEEPLQADGRPSPGNEKQHENGNEGEHVLSVHRSTPRVNLRFAVRLRIEARWNVVDLTSLNRF